MRRIPELTREDLKRFWSKVNKGDSCWFWTAGIDKDGYGKFWINPFHYRANRISFSIINGDPGDEEVCHTCDNPTCVNPEHLWCGTTLDNARDRNRKERQAKGEKIGRSKLTKAMVKEILASDETQKILAERYGIRQTNVSMIKRGMTWKHIRTNRYSGKAAVNSQTGVTGISPCSSGKFRVDVSQNGKRVYLGRFGSVSKAKLTLENWRETHG